MRRLLLFFFLAACDAQEASSIENRLIVLSAPRSGTHFLVHSLQLLTGRPFRFFHKNAETDRDFDQRANLLHETRVDPDLSTYFFTHHPGDLSDAIAERNSLLLLVRNPKELFCRQMMHCREFEREGMIQDRRRYRQFLALLRLYHSWNPERRMLVYYEDLMESPPAVMADILSWMGESAALIPWYADHLPAIRGEVIDHYNRRHRHAGGAITQGRSPLFHSLTIAPHLLQAIEDNFLAEDPLLTRLYLSRYQS